MNVAEAKPELERMVERRSRNEVDPDEREELWKESVRRHNTQRREANRAGWIGHHEKMIRVHEGLADEHREKITRLQEARA